MERRSFLAATAAGVYDVGRFGAAGDGRRNDRPAIQRAIDECAKAGGGIVRVPPGRFLSGNLRLKSGIALWLDHGATLAASGDPRDYEVRRPVDRTPRDNWGSAFLLAEKAERVAILGSGVIRGGDLAKPRGKGKPLEPFRPRLVSFEGCRDVLVNGVTLRDSDRWTLHFHQCDHVRASELRILAAYGIVNTDGIDVDGCRNVIISGCEIIAGDDCIVLKTTDYLGDPRPMENITVTNCVLSTRANGFKIGTETHAGISNIAFSNSIVYGEGEVRPNSAVSLETVDGARIDGVSISNITARRVKAPVFLRLGDRSRPAPGAPCGRLENVVIQNVVAVDASMTSSIMGIPGHAVENVTLSSLRFVMEGGGGPELANRPVPEREAAYPDATMFGQLPALGLYARHVRGLVIRDLDVSAARPDARPVLAVDDVAKLHADGVRLDGTAVSVPGSRQ